MSNIKNWAIEQIESDSNVDLEFREALAGFRPEILNRSDKTLEINRILDSMIESCANAEQYFAEAAKMLNISTGNTEFDKTVSDDLEDQAYKWGER